VLTPRNQGKHGLGLGKSAQILKIAVLAIHMLDITVTEKLRRGGQNGDAVGFHLGHQRLAPTGILRVGNSGHE
jgi:hypothetical protein